MKAIQEMKIIQIDITNACSNLCSNCTRFCGHHTNPFFMEYSFFKKAVNSLSGYSGCVGIIGGEPTLHPEFEKFADFIRSQRENGLKNNSRMPIFDFTDHLNKNLSNKNAKTGLWSSLGKKYYQHFETISDTFSYQILNDHNNLCFHQALLISRKELNISDNVWIKKRDKCWIQNHWSATITPKGAFFCEVAGALDLLFNGPGGWDIIDNNWWKKKPSDFKDQLHWCEICSAALNVPRRISSEEIDDVSPLLLEKLKTVKSPKIGKKKFEIFDVNSYQENKYKCFSSENEYMEKSLNDRISKNNRSIHPKSFDVFPDFQTFIFSSEKINIDWVVLSDTPQKAERIIKKLNSVILNPGCLYYHGDTILFNPLSRTLRNITDKEKISEVFSCYPKNKIFNLRFRLLFLLIIVKFKSIIKQLFFMNRY